MSFLQLYLNLKLQILQWIHNHIYRKIKLRKSFLLVYSYQYKCECETSILKKRHLIISVVAPFFKLLYRLGLWCYELRPSWLCKMLLEQLFMIWIEEYIFLGLIWGRESLLGCSLCGNLFHMVHIEFWGIWNGHVKLHLFWILECWMIWADEMIYNLFLQNFWDL